MDEELLEIVELLKKTLKELLKNPRVMIGCDVSQEEIEIIETTNKLSLEVLEHLAGDRFFETYYQKINLNQKEAEEIAKFLKSSAKYFFEELKEIFPYLER